MAEQQIEQSGALRGDAPLTIDILQPEKSTPAGDDGAFSSQSPTPTAVTSDNDAGDLDITNLTGLAPQTTESQMNGLWEETGDVKDENNDVNPNNGTICWTIEGLVCFIYRETDFLVLPHYSSNIEFCLECAIEKSLKNHLLHCIHPKLRARTWTVWSQMMNK